MSIDIERVRRLFQLFADLDGLEGARWGSLCRRAAAGIAARLRPETDPTLHQDRLAMAAAIVAYGDYLLLESGGASAGEELKVGDVSIKTTADRGNARREEALNMKSDALADIRDLITGGEQVFFAIGGGEESS
jgi:hypothetical protein